MIFFHYYLERQTIVLLIEKRMGTFSLLFSLFGSDLALLLSYFVSTMVEMKHTGLRFLKYEILCLDLHWFLTNTNYFK